MQHSLNKHRKKRFDPYSGEETVPEFQVAPMVDVLLVLLLFFMATATTEVVLEAGHCPHDEVPDQVNAALLEWIGGLSAAAAARPAVDLVPAAGPDRTAA